MEAGAPGRLLQELHCHGKHTAGENMSEIYLIRHGQASFGQENYDRLSALGVRQAKRVGRHLAELGRSFDAIYSGRLARQKKTAEALVAEYARAGLKVPALTVSEAFDEYESKTVWESQIRQMAAEDPGVAEALDDIYADRKAFQYLFAKVMMRWVSGEFDRPGVQRWKDYQRRVQEGLREIMRRHGSKKRLAVFTSGGPITIAVQTALDLSDRKAIELNWQIMNASVTRLLYNAGGTALSVFNDVTHLETADDTGLISFR
jgi:broad specificity phosphatase PhoE